MKSSPKMSWQLKPGNTKRGKYHCTIDLLFDWFGISCMTTDNFCCYFINRLIQTSQTGGQWYSETSPFSIPCSNYKVPPHLKMMVRSYPNARFDGATTFSITTLCIKTLSRIYWYDTWAEPWYTILYICGVLLC